MMLSNDNQNINSDQYRALINGTLDKVDTRKTACTNTARFQINMRA